MKHYTHILQALLLSLAACGGASKDGAKIEQFGTAGSDILSTGGTGGSETQGTGGTSEGGFGGEGGNGSVSQGGNDSNGGTASGGASSNGGSQASSGGNGGSDGQGGTTGGLGGTSGTAGTGGTSSLGGTGGTESGGTGGTGSIVDCNSGEFRCASGTLQVCDSSEEWVIASETAVCDGNNRRVCSGDNLVTAETCEFLCSNGVCAGECNPGDSQCSGLTIFTCENYQWISEETCTAGSHSTPTCIGEVCGIDCENGYEDCDGNTTNGCEVETVTATNCGGCGILCGPGVQCINSECVGSNGTQAIAHGSSFPASLEVQNSTVLWVDGPTLKVRDFGLHRSLVVDFTDDIMTNGSPNAAAGRVVRSGVDEFVVRFGGRFFLYNDVEETFSLLLHDDGRSFGSLWEVDSNHIYWVESAPGGSQVWRFTFGDPEPVSLGLYREMDPTSAFPYQLAGSFLVLSVQDAGGSGWQFINKTSGTQSFVARDIQFPNGMQKCLGTNLVAATSEWVITSDCKMDVATKAQTPIDMGINPSPTLTDVDSNSFYRLRGSSIRRTEIINGDFEEIGTISVNPGIIRNSVNHVYWMDSSKIWRTPK